MKLYLIHIPKSAGASVYLTYKNQDLKLWGHNSRRSSYKTFPSSLTFKISKIIPFKIFRTFTIVRNPWDRVVSAYSYLLKGGNCKEDESDGIVYVTPFLDFEDFIKNGLKKASIEQLHFMPQLHWVSHNKKIVVDSVLRFSELDHQLREFLKEHGRELAPLKEVHKVKRALYTSFYSEETKSIVAEIYKDEIQMFGFCFEDGIQ